MERKDRIDAFGATLLTGFSVLLAFNQVVIRVVDEGLQEADARVISRATVPGVPFYPQKKVIVLVALFFSTVVSVGIAILLELLDSGFRRILSLRGR